MKKKMNPICSFVKYAKKKVCNYQILEGSFICNAQFEEFPGILAGIQIDWMNNSFLTSILEIVYEPKNAEACDFKNIINNLNAELWGITYVWLENRKRILCKIIEQPKQFSITDVETLFNHINYYGNQLLKKIYPRSKKAQLEWQQHADALLYLEEAPIAGRA